MGEERREYPRIEAELRAEVSTREGRSVAVTVVNISRSGFCLRLDRDAALALSSRGLLSPGDSLRLRMSLPVQAERLACAAKCKTVWVRRLGQHTYELGGEFQRFEAKGTTALERYIEDCLSYS